MRFFLVRMLPGILYIPDDSLISHRVRITRNDVTAIRHLIAQVLQITCCVIQLDILDKLRLYPEFLMSQRTVGSCMLMTLCFVSLS